MDKETLSNYGWIVICVLVLSVMIALATPFGTFVSDAVQNTTQGLFKTEQNAVEKGLGATGIKLEDATFGDVNTVGGSGSSECKHTNKTTYGDDAKCNDCNAVIYGTETHSGLIPEGSQYYYNVFVCECGCVWNPMGDYYNDYCYQEGITNDESYTYDVLNAGDEFPVSANNGDIYFYGGCYYGYNCYQDEAATCWKGTNGWGVYSPDKQTEPLISSLYEKPIVCLDYAFLDIAQTIPETVTSMDYAFAYADELTGTIEINATLRYSGYETFAGIDFQAQKITLTGTCTMLDELGATGYNYCNECNGYCEKGHTLVNPQ